MEDVASANNMVGSVEAGAELLFLMLLISSVKRNPEVRPPRNPEPEFSFKGLGGGTSAAFEAFQSSLS